MKYLRFLAPAFLIFALPACQDIEQTMTDAYYTIVDMGVPSVSENVKAKPLSERLVDKGACPAVEIAEELGSFYDFTSGGLSPDNLISRADLAQQNACSYGPKSVTIDVRLKFAAALGPRGRTGAQNEPFFSYPYFVAIMAPGGKILAKEVFAASITFAPGADQQTFTENLRQIIPIHNQENGASHKVVIGFQLTKDQLAYNREIADRRRKVAAAAALEERRREQMRQQRRAQIQRELPPGTAETDAAAETLPAAEPASGPVILAPQAEPGKLNQ